MNRIEIIKDNFGYTVRVDDKFADHLGPDEALGVVAAALFSGMSPPYLKSYEGWTHWESRHGRIDEPVALLTDQRVIDDVAIRFKPDPRAKVTYPFRIFPQGIKL